MQAIGKMYGWRSVRRGWFVVLTLFGIGVPGIAFSQINGSKDEISGTISQSEPPLKQDGTLAYPYSDASQCPSRTDLIFGPAGCANLNEFSGPNLSPASRASFMQNR
jgi:hypothetical protein